MFGERMRALLVRCAASWWSRLSLLLNFCFASGCFVEIDYPENSAVPALDRGWPTDGSTSADAQFGGADLDLNLADVDRLDTSVVNVADAMSPLDMSQSPSDVALTDMTSSHDMRLAVDMTRQLDMGETEGFDPTGWLHSFRIRITPPEIEAEVQHVLVYLKVPVEELDLSQFVALPRHEFMFVTTDGEEVPFEIVTCSLAGRSGELALILRLPRILSRTQPRCCPAEHSISRCMWEIHQPWGLCSPFGCRMMQ